MSERESILTGALQDIVDEKVGHLLRRWGEEDTDYFLRCINNIKEHARNALKATGAAS